MRDNYAQKCLAVLQQLDHARDTGHMIIFLDEVNFTKRSVMAREYSCKNTNLTLDQEDIYTGYRSVISTMSEEAGMVHMQIQNSAVNAEDFI